MFLQIFQAGEPAVKMNEHELPWFSCTHRTTLTFPSFFFSWINGVPSSSHLKLRAVLRSWRTSTDCAQCPMSNVQRWVCGGPKPRTNSREQCLHGIILLRSPWVTSLVQPCLLVCLLVCLVIRLLFHPPTSFNKHQFIWGSHFASPLKLRPQVHSSASNSSRVAIEVLSATPPVMRQGWWCWDDIDPVPSASEGPGPVTIGFHAPQQRWPPHRWPRWAEGHRPSNGPGTLGTSAMHCPRRLRLVLGKSCEHWSYYSIVEQRHYL